MGGHPTRYRPHGSWALRAGSELILTFIRRPAELAHVFLTSITEQANDAIRRVKELQDLSQRWQTQLQDANATVLMHRVAGLLSERPILSAQDICTQFNVSHQTAMRAIQKLIEVGIYVHFVSKIIIRLQLCSSMEIRQSRVAMHTNRGCNPSQAKRGAWRQIFIKPHTSPGSPQHAG